MGQTEGAMFPGPGKQPEETEVPTLSEDGKPLSKGLL